ncbi:MAG: hypothetical protein RL407_1581 [Bacteroidota bacterium]|jgi:uncharacterized membrane protein
MKEVLKLIFLYGFGLFFILAGGNHFLSPDFYLPLIPPYFPFPHQINGISGAAEIVLGLGLWIKGFRKYASWGIIILLLAFIPSHIYFIQVGSCIAGGLCVPLALGWIRLLLIHPILLFWAYWSGKQPN